jgi:hypothetical protein
VLRFPDEAANPVCNTGVTFTIGAIVRPLPPREEG